MASNSRSNRPLAARLGAAGSSIFTEVTLLAQRHRAVNLGQGFPDFDGPDWLLSAASDALRAGRNQYARSFGLPELNAAIAAHQNRFYALDVDPETEVTVYAGATEAIFAAVQALTDPGDEVILFEPYYDSYRGSVTIASAVPRVVTLHAPRFEFDDESLERAVNARTRLLILNSPHNPTGKVFSRSELERIAALCLRHDLIAITDEVYEHLVYEGEHLPLASLPGMRERTVTISSAGKTFSVTGWKIGWSVAAPELTRLLRAAHQFITFSNGTPFQVAIASALGTDDSFYRQLTAEYRARKELLLSGLREARLSVIEPAGTYFAVVDVRSLGRGDGEEFCRMLPERYGVAAIPCSAFYDDKSAGSSLVRFAFCKTDAVLRAGVERLREVGR